MLGGFNWRLGYVPLRIGMALTDSLDELITSGAITPQLAMKVLQQVCVVPVNLQRRGPAHPTDDVPPPRGGPTVRQVPGGHHGEAGEDEDDAEGMCLVPC